MKEKEFINIIKNITKSQYIGDDCAYLEDIEIVVSQDNLAEGIHFSLEHTNPYKLGYKSAMVNISDIAASGAEPAYMTIGLSLPKNIDEKFIENFYKGVKDASSEIKIVGGDITGGEKIFVSIAIIGKARGRKISSRKNAKEGYKVIVSGEHGSSAAGLKELFAGRKNKFTRQHLMPKAQVEFSKYIAQNIKTDYAMMDTSDGLMDALMQISAASNVMLDIEFNKIPYDKDLESFDNYKDLILYGGEDYLLVACVPENFYVPESYEIGRVVKGSGVKIDGKIIENPDAKLFNHFKEQK